MTVFQAQPGSRDAITGVHAPAATEGPAFDVRILRASVGDEPEILLEIVGCFDEVASGIRDELLGVAEHWQDDVAASCAEAARLAHTLKSSAASVGAMPLASLCVQLERSSMERDAETARALLAAVPGGVDQALAAMRGWRAQAMPATAPTGNLRP